MEDLEDLLYRVGKLLTSPREAFYVHIVERHPLSLPLLIYIVLSFALTSLPVKTSFLLLGLPAVAFRLPLELLSEFSGVIGAAFSISWLILYATIIHLVARISGYATGRWEETLCAVAYSIIPQSMTAFLMGLSYLFASYELLLISLVFLFLAFIWSIYIVVEEVSLIYDLTIGRSVLISLLGPLMITISSLGILSLIGPPGLAIVIVLLVALYYWREIV
ncbi:MAG: Yip1 family protein [Candidatus Korarchaeum sp.]